MAPYLVDQAGGLSNLTDDQRGAIVTVSTLVGGMTAAVLGQNVTGATTAAANESLNNATNVEDLAHGKDLVPLEGGGGGPAEDYVGEPNSPNSGGLGDDAAPSATASPAVSAVGEGSVDLGTGANDWSDATNNSLPTNASQLSHIFRDDVGHLADTPQNQQTLSNMVNNPQNLLGPDSYGNQWYAQTLPDGTQLWGSVRNGVIQNGGLNATPKTYNPATGLSRAK